MSPLPTPAEELHALQEHYEYEADKLKAEVERLTNAINIALRCNTDGQMVYTLKAALKEQPAPPILVRENDTCGSEHYLVPPAAPLPDTPEWRRCTKKPLTIEYRDAAPGEVITTIEGVHITMDADHYVMRGTHGELYPITKQIFGETYEPVTAAPNAPKTKKDEQK